MKSIKKYLSVLFIVILQNAYSQEIVVPLTNPGKPGKLDVSLIHGSIKVTGYNGKEVVVNVTADSGKEKPSETNGTMRRIPNNSIGMDITEEDNHVKIGCGCAGSGKSVSLEIKVPREFSMKIRTVNDGDLIVENVDGEIEASNTNGDVIMNNVEGVVVANTINGDVNVKLNKITPDKSMAFSNLNGKLDVTVPANTKANVKFKSDFGEIYTDFELQMDSNNPSVNPQKKGDKKIYNIDKWVSGKINGGGASFSFKSMHGNIYLRKK
jgi:hypothetical protein